VVPRSDEAGCVDAVELALALVAEVDDEDVPDADAVDTEDVVTDVPVVADVVVAREVTLAAALSATKPCPQYDGAFIRKMVSSQQYEEAGPAQHHQKGAVPVPLTQLTMLEYQFV